MTEALVYIPEKAKIGELIEIQSLIAHPIQIMTQSEKINLEKKQNFIERLTVKFNKNQIFAAEFTSKLSANPYISFFFKATETGTLLFTWYETSGRKWAIEKKLQVVK